VVLGTAMAVSAVIVGVNYWLDIRQAEEAAAAEFVTIAQQSALRASELRLRGEEITLSMRSRQMSLAASGADELALMRSMKELMHAQDNIFSLFAGRAEGDYFEVSNMLAAEGVREAWKAQEGERWVALRVGETEGERRETRMFLDGDLQISRTEQMPSDFLANERPWFKKASAEAVSEVGPYRLSMVGERGISFATRASDGVVVGAIVLLSTLDALLESQRYPDTFASMIFSRSGRIIASNHNVAALMERVEPGEEFGAYAVLARLAADPDRHNRLQRVAVGDEPHLLWAAPVSAIAPVGEVEYVGMLVSADEVLEAYRRQALTSLLLSLGMVVLLLPVAFAVTGIIAKPIRQLTGESEKVRQRNYAQVERVDTHVSEVAWLSSAMVSMAGSIQDYEQKQRDLHEAIVKLIAEAIDQKSPYTGGHCRRVPDIALALAEAASNSTDAAFADFSFTSDEDWREFRIAAWLHDCGKITTPEHIVDKGSKLETLYNRIHEIRMRFEVLLRDAEIAYWEGRIADPAQEAALREVLEVKRQQLREDFAFVARCNVGGEAMADADLERLEKIGGLTWKRQLDDRLGLSPLEAARAEAFSSTTPATERLLADKPEHCMPWESQDDRYPGMGFAMQPPALKQNLGELYNLGIRRGTLTDEDRYLINEHIAATIKMLEGLPWPDDLRRVPEYAGGHHEKMDGTGYPRGIPGDELSMPARIMAIADIMEALTAGDRPYKNAKTVPEALAIMQQMADGGHIDAALFGLFVEEVVKG
jgi:HD-GYP domain-containing protein (c-di-GMP phosphodiesterase class II)